MVGIRGMSGQQELGTGWGCAASSVGGLLAGHQRANPYGDWSRDASPERQMTPYAPG